MILLPLILFAIFIFYQGIKLSCNLFFSIKEQFNLSLETGQKAALSLKIKIPFWREIEVSFVFSAFLGPLLINGAFFLTYFCIFNSTYFNFDKVNNVNTFVNVLSFTVTTGTTLSYGDIIPIHWLSKLLSISQLLINLLEVSLVVYGFGKGGAWLVGKAEGDGSPSGPNSPNSPPNSPPREVNEKLDKTMEELRDLMSEIKDWPFYNLPSQPHYYFLLHEIERFIRAENKNQEISDEEFSRRILEIIKKYRR